MISISGCLEDLQQDYIDLTASRLLTQTKEHKMIWGRCQAGTVSVSGLYLKFKLKTQKQHQLCVEKMHPILQ